MLKGVNKLIIEINNPESEYFERAIFFVRPSKTEIGIGNLKYDADLILSEAEIKHLSADIPNESVFKKIVIFLLCLGVGAISSGITMLIISP
ncbi:MAG: hypothetical protein LBR74_06460 [Eubacterium sp.]|jgi:hypothetical protein|nr:hypothetical protein [Eubacterium sp.]